ncbi:nucleotidyltransferase domain-containing protein [Rhizobiaceae bacterium BDR2-2]|uniref:Nucleotidyltransferase domain-containing protein n=1 Tax=Ectorhizobium quercum TaxID=2965071 RepID=A0AAE3MXZ4_9HYPH|nr:nucleotidyltransferase domain-containing protein [Ectorhizobium quercum]MCX8996536.1 nucleotidyltransferase domain-containing protein [Ectorhizobium quercum]
MHVDADGLIGTVGEAPYQDEFCPVLKAVRFRLVGDAGSLVHSIYVYGSVAAGCAIPGRSDLDLSLILNTPPSMNERALLERIRQETESDHPVVSKIDFDIGSLGDFASPDAGMAWRYWLKHHCRCIEGEDLASGIVPFAPSKALALAVNDDFSTVLGQYVTLLREEPPARTSQRLVREASRKVVRATNILRLETDRDWPATLEDHAERFCRLFPEQAREMRYFLEQAHEPVAEPADFTRRLRLFKAWMETVIRNDTPSSQ